MGEKQLAQYNQQYVDLMAQHRSAVNRLPSLKGREKRLTKRAIRQLNRQIRKLIRLIKETQNEIRKTDKIETQQILANQGIDSKANIASTIASSTAQVASSAIETFGGGALGMANNTATKKTNLNIEPNYMLYGVIGIVAFMMLKKK